MTELNRAGYLRYFWVDVPEVAIQAAGLGAADLSQNSI